MSRAARRDAATAQTRAAAAVARFVGDPLGYVRAVFPWGRGPLAQFDGPRAWQAETFERLAAHLADPATRHTPFRDAVASGHGIGKSAEIAMLTKWALDTRPGTRVVVAANSETQAYGKFLPELVKWHRLSATRDLFRATGGGLVSVAPGLGKVWRADVVAWSAHNPDSFAALHNAGGRLMLVFDEAASIDDCVWEGVQGALTDVAAEVIWLARGNPLRRTGGFRDCFTRDRALWTTRRIDTRTVEGINQANVDEIVRHYGVDSDLVRARIRGEFPHPPGRRFIDAERVAAARTRQADTSGSPPLVFGLDCARFGADESVLAVRCGRDARSIPWLRWQGEDTMQLAAAVALHARIWRPDAVFVDGGAMGGAVVDRLRQLGVTGVAEVHFGARGHVVEWAPGTLVRTADRRTELWTRMRAWLATGAIPDEAQLADDLTSLDYVHTADGAIRLENKANAKARGIASPDAADALACTFAQAAPAAGGPERCTCHG